MPLKTVKNHELESDMRIALPFDKEGLVKYPPKVGYKYVTLYVESGGLTNKVKLEKDGESQIIVEDGARVSLAVGLEQAKPAEEAPAKKEPVVDLTKAHEAWTRRWTFAESVGQVVGPPPEGEAYVFVRGRIAKLVAWLRGSVVPEQERYGVKFSIITMAGLPDAVTHHHGYSWAIDLLLQTPYSNEEVASKIMDKAATIRRG